jgi:hypothetical protein
MRAAMQADRSLLESALKRHSKSVNRVMMVISYKGRRGGSQEKMTSTMIRKDVEMFCRTVASKV